MPSRDDGHASSVVRRSLPQPREARRPRQPRPGARIGRPARVASSRDLASGLRSETRSQGPARQSGGSIEHEESRAPRPDSCFVADRAVSERLLHRLPADQKEKPRGDAGEPVTRLRLSCKQNPPAAADRRAAHRGPFVRKESLPLGVPGSGWHHHLVSPAGSGSARFHGGLGAHIIRLADRSESRQLILAWLVGLGLVVVSGLLPSAVGYAVILGGCVFLGAVLGAHGRDPSGLRDHRQ